MNPAASTVYVDCDPIAVAMGREIIAGDSRTTMLEGDLCRPADILGDPDTQRLIDFSRPVAVVLVAVLHAVPDAGEPAALVAQLAATPSPAACWWSPTEDWGPARPGRRGREPRLPHEHARDPPNR